MPQPVAGCDQPGQQLGHQRQRRPLSAVVELDRSGSPVR